MLRQKWRIDAGNLSGGEQQILEMAMVLLVEPTLLLLDEPSLGLSPKMQGDVFATVQRIAATGVTVLIVEQNVRGALLISDRALVMEQGATFMEGPAAEVRTDPRIRQAYLGGNIQQTSEHRFMRKSTIGSRHRRHLHRPRASNGTASAPARKVLTTPRAPEEGVLDGDRRRSSQAPG